MTFGPNTLVVPHGVRVPGYHKVGEIGGGCNSLGGAYGSGGFPGMGGFPGAGCHPRHHRGMGAFQGQLGGIPGNPSFARCMMTQPGCASQTPGFPGSTANASAFAGPGFASASAFAGSPFGPSSANASAFAGPGFASANASAQATGFPGFRPF